MPGGFSIVVGVRVIVREAAEVLGEVQGHRCRVVVLHADLYRGAAQGVQEVQAVSEESFGQALAAVVRVGEKFIDDCFTVAFGDDEGGRDLTVGSECHEGRCLGGAAAALLHGWADPHRVSGPLSGTVGVGVPVQIGQFEKIIGFQGPDPDAGRRGVLVSGRGNQGDRSVHDGDAFPGARAAPLNTVSGIVRARGRHRTATISGGADTAGPQRRDRPKTPLSPLSVTNRTPRDGTPAGFPVEDSTGFAVRRGSGPFPPFCRRRPAAARPWRRSRATMAASTVRGWLRAFAASAGPIAEVFTALSHRDGADAAGLWPAPAPTPAGRALAAVAAYAGVLAARFSVATVAWQAAGLTASGPWFFSASGWSGREQHELALMPGTPGGKGGSSTSLPASPGPANNH